MRPAPVAEPVQRLIDELGRLPGIGPKSAQRLTYFLLRVPDEQIQALAEAIQQIKERTTLCSICQNITESDPCNICSHSSRDRSIICIVEDPLDIMALERAKSYQGIYHVLHGLISPMDGVGPGQLKVRELLHRMDSGEVREIILATNPSLEGDATAMYIQRLISPLGIRVTRLARGLPNGSDLEYADEITLSRAVEARQDM
ncbi:MAG: recombination protein RecR [Dehalococcoidia bacterium]|nr:recombination protein RecR [Dehalococcoidia bacterium]